MYNLDPKKLLKSVSGSQHHATVIRWCLDFMYVIKKSHTASMAEIKKAWPFNKESITEESFRIAPEFLTLIMSESDEPTVFSRPLKHHFDQERIMKQLGQSMEIDTISAKKKIQDSLSEQELEVIKDTKGIALLSYNGMIPTRSYAHSREVFFVTGAFYSYLVNKFPKVDIDEKLKEAHQYFCQCELARRHHASLKGYLEAWVSGDLLKLNKLRRKKPQICKDAFYKEFMND